jgi:hypothetical protein
VSRDLGDDGLVGDGAGDWLGERRLRVGEEVEVEFFCGERRLLFLDEIELRFRVGNEPRKRPFLV